VAGPKKPHRIHDEASLDLRHGARFYERQRRGLGQEFVLAVDVAIAKIVEAPQRWPRFFGAQRYLSIGFHTASSIESSMSRSRCWR
jgi:hypothetical protein